MACCDEEAEQFQQLWAELTLWKEKIGEVAIKKLLIQGLVDAVEMDSGGDDTLFILEENRSESLQRVKALNLDGRLGMLHDECAKSAVEWWINRISLGAVMEGVEMDAVVAKLGFLSKECGELYDECAKSAAELCIKKMRYAALVYKCDKRTILQSEIDEVKRMTKVLKKRLITFQRNLMLNELSKKKDSQEDVIVKENDVVGGAAQDEKSTEISGDELKKMDCATCKEKVPDLKDVKGSAFEKQSFRVVLELMKGVKNVAPGGVDKAVALADEWAAANTDLCLVKVTVGVVMERRSVFEVLKNAIVEAWRVEKKVKDRYVIYQMKVLGSRSNVDADIIEEKYSRGGTVVSRGDERKLVNEDGLGLVCEKFGRRFSAVGMVAAGGLAVGMGMGIGLGLSNGKAKKWLMKVLSRSA